MAFVMLVVRIVHLTGHIQTSSISLDSREPARERRDNCLRPSSDACRAGHHPIRRGWTHAEVATKETAQAHSVT